MIDINNANKFIPHFGEKDFSDIFTNKNNRVFNISDCSFESFENYCKLFEEKGFIKREYRNHGEFHFAAFEGGSTGIFVIFHGNLKEINITVENESKYFEYSDILHDKKVSSQLTQLTLEVYGMSYVIRLSDGRFIIIDGGDYFEPHWEKLFKHLKDSSPDDKPVIAAWIITHPDSDHYHCFIGFCEHYASDVILQKVMFNFPEHNAFDLFPGMQVCRRKGADYEMIPYMYKVLSEIGVPIYTPHTGQVYEIGNASLEFLNCIGDIIHCTEYNNKNETCLVIRMEIEGQTILWLADSSCKYSRYYEKYGEFLKADILQLPHHGYGFLGYEEEIKCYNTIKPSVCFVSVADYHYKQVAAFRKSTNYAITKLGVDEIITGNNGKTLTLPYKAPKTAKEEYKQQYTEAVMNNGAHCWYFTGLNSANKDDFVFSFINLAVQDAEMEINIYFKDSNDIERIKASVPTSLSELCIIDKEKVDGNWPYFNPNSLNKIEIPESTEFAVRFISDIPLVIFHKDHKDTYHTSYVK